MWLYGDARNLFCRAWIRIGAEMADSDPGNGNYGWRDMRPLSLFQSSMGAKNDHPDEASPTCPRQANDHAAITD
jgi:hypothetical protein